MTLDAATGDPLTLVPGAPPATPVKDSENGTPWAVPLRSLSEMTPCERAATSGFQISLELDRALFVHELDDDIVRQFLREAADDLRVACQPELAHECRRAEVGGPDLSQMEPTEQLDAPNRRLPESRVRRFARRKCAFRPTSISS